MKQHGYLIDMDGVIYHGSAAIDGAAEFIAFLQAEQTPFLFLTNNSTYTPVDVIVKLRKFGIECTPDHVYTSAQATAAKGGVIGIQFGATFNHPAYYQWAFKKPPVANISEQLAHFATMSIEEVDRVEAKGLPFVFKGTIPQEYQMGTDHLARVIDYGVKLVGEDHIALGADFDGGPQLPREMKDISDYPEITKAMLRMGYSEQRIRKILGLNWLRLIRTVTKN